jgi:hypothetical protein
MTDKSNYAENLQFLALSAIFSCFSHFQLFQPFSAFGLSWKKGEGDMRVG